MRYFTFLVLFLAAFGTQANAQDIGQRLANCLIAQTTGSDRVALARWIGFSIAAHSSIARSVAIPEDTLEQSDKQIANLMTDLLTQRCVDETRAVFAVGGDAAMESAFDALGRVAMSEVMLDENVNSSLTRFLNYLNESEFEGIMTD